MPSVPTAATTDQRRINAMHYVTIIAGGIESHHIVQLLEDAVVQEGLVMAITGCNGSWAAVDVHCLDS